MPQRYVSPLPADFSVVRQLSSPYVWLCFQVFLLPANSPVNPPRPSAKALWTGLPISSVQVGHEYKRD